MTDPRPDSAASHTSSVDTTSWEILSASSPIPNPGTTSSPVPDPDQPRPASPTPLTADRPESPTGPKGSSSEEDTVKDTPNIEGEKADQPNGDSASEVSEIQEEVTAVGVKTTMADKKDSKKKSEKKSDSFYYPIRPAVLPQPERKLSSDDSVVDDVVEPTSTPKGGSVADPLSPLAPPSVSSVGYEGKDEYADETESQLRDLKDDEDGDTGPTLGEGDLSTGTRTLTPSESKRGDSSWHGSRPLSPVKRSSSQEKRPSSPYKRPSSPDKPLSSPEWRPASPTKKPSVVDDVLEGGYRPSTGSRASGTRPAYSFLMDRSSGAGSAADHYSRSGSAADRYSGSSSAADRYLSPRHDMDLVSLTRVSNFLPDLLSGIRLANVTDLMVCQKGKLC